MENHKVVDSKFRLVILASKRAKQLLRGGKKKVDLNAENPLTVALEEIKQGKIDYEIILTEDLVAEETGEEMPDEDQELAGESLSEFESEESLDEDEDETGTGDDGDAEVVAQTEDKQPD